MRKQNSFDGERADAADRLNPGKPIASGLSRQQIQALLGGDRAAASRRAFLAATLAAGATAAVAAPPPSTQALIPSAISRKWGCLPVTAPGSSRTFSPLQESLDINKRPALDFDDPRRFLAHATRTMRGLVIDRVRSRYAQKRGGDVVITSLDTLNADQVEQPETLEGIGEALEKLEAVDPDLAHVVDLKFFCGFTLAEVASMKGVSR